MGFSVEIQPRAFEDLDSISTYIRERSNFATAEKWFNKLIDDVASLAENPERCAIAPESQELGQEVRVLLHGRRNRSYKIYFAVEREGVLKGKVSVFHVRHWARRPLTNDELTTLKDTDPQS